MVRRQKHTSAHNLASTRRKKITVLLDADQAERFQSYCRERGFKKSTLVARLIREYLDSERVRTKRKSQ